MHQVIAACTEPTAYKHFSEQGQHLHLLHHPRHLRHRVLPILPRLNDNRVARLLLDNVPALRELRRRAGLRHHRVEPAGVPARAVRAAGVAVRDAVGARRVRLVAWVLAVPGQVGNGLAPDFGPPEGVRAGGEGNEEDGEEGDWVAKLENCDVVGGRVAYREQRWSKPTLRWSSSGSTMSAQTLFIVSECASVWIERICALELSFVSSLELPGIISQCWLPITSLQYCRQWVVKR